MESVECKFFDLSFLFGEFDFFMSDFYFIYKMFYERVLYNELLCNWI